MTKDEALRMALDALEHEAEIGNDDAYRKERDAIRKALAQPEQEPVAYLDEGLGAFYWAKDYKKHVGFKPLYTTPPQRKPLTDWEIEVWAKKPISRIALCRAIEAAHGIKE